MAAGQTIPSWSNPHFEAIYEYNALDHSDYGHGSFRGQDIDQQ